MSRFIHDDFLLNSKWAVDLFHGTARDLPVIDYHNHLSPRLIAEDQRFGSITEAWLEHDHYKWRAMRWNGINEELITGAASDWEKFRAFAETVPYLLRNPLYHWTHLELARYFDIHDLLCPENARRIYDECNERLSSPEYSSRNLLRRMKVEHICTTDEPTDELVHHRSFAETPHDFVMQPAFRGDRLLSFHDRRSWIVAKDELAAASRISINGADDFLKALLSRVELFHNLGCRLADFGFSSLPEEPAEGVAESFSVLLQGRELSPAEAESLRLHFLLKLCAEFRSRNWVQQFHLGPLRNNSSRVLKHTGRDAGADSIGDFPQAKGLRNLLDSLDRRGRLARTILYNSNPADNHLFATIAGSFQDGSAPGKIQHGASWWFLDQKEGIEGHLNALSSVGLLRRFVGMTTDSRSILSFSRHEYFRRILCNLLGEEVERGLLPADEALLAAFVRDVCYENARSWFCR
jgi:glucuronate isomerase